MRVPMHQRAERGHQHHVGGGTGFPGERRGTVDGFRRQLRGGPLRAPGAGNHRAVGAGKLKRLRQIRHQRTPISLIFVTASHRVGGDIQRRCRAGVDVGAGEVGEERGPRAVVPGDMVRGEQQDQLVGAHPRGRDPQRRVLGQVERLA